LATVVVNIFAYAIETEWKPIMMNVINFKNTTLKLICVLACSLLLSSCVYYSVQRDFGGNQAEPCTKGSSKQNAKCKAEIKAVNAEIKRKSPH